MKKIVCFIFTICISILLIMLAFSFSIKNVIVSTINTEITSKEIASKLSSMFKKYNVPDDELEKIETTIINSDETSKITEKYVEGLVGSLIEDKNNIPNIDKELENLVNESEKIINDSEISLNEDEKQEIVNRLSSDGKLGMMYDVISTDVKQKITDNELKYFSLYKKIVSKEFKIIVISIILIMLLLIGSIKDKFYKCILNMSISFVLSGLFILYLLPMFVDFIVNNVLQDVGNYKVNLRYLFNIGYIYIGIFGLILIIYLILKKVLDYNKSKYDY